MSCLWCFCASVPAQIPLFSGIIERERANSGYTGKFYIVIDDEDDQEQLYYRKYGENVIKFCKKNAAKKTDVMTPSRKRNAVVFARNECWKIAKDLNSTHFCVLDDDYKMFEFRHAKLRATRINDFDSVITAFCEFLETSCEFLDIAEGVEMIGTA